MAAAVLASLHRARQRPWLRSWAWSWLFLAFHNLFSAVAYVASRTGVASQPRVVIASLAAVAGFAQLVFLLAGAREVATDDPLSPQAARPGPRVRRGRRGPHLPSRLLGPLGGLPPILAPLRLRVLTAGIVFLVAAVLVRRA